MKKLLSLLVLLLLSVGLVNAEFVGGGTAGEFAGLWKLIGTTLSPTNSNATVSAGTGKFTVIFSSGGIIDGATIATTATGTLSSVKLNNALSELEYEKSPRGVLAMAVTSGTTALTYNQFSNTAFDVTGVLVSNAIVTIPDGVPQQFIVDNETSGAFTLTFKNATDSGSGVAVTQGTRTILYSNGAKVEDVVAAGTGAVTSVFGRAGAVTAQSGDYTKEQITGLTLASSPTFSGAVLTGLTVISDFAGSGALNITGAANFASTLGVVGTTTAAAITGTTGNFRTSIGTATANTSALNATGAVSFASTLSSTGSTVALFGPPEKTIVGDTTLGLDDVGYHIRINSGATVAITIPNSGSVAFANGTVISFVQAGAGTGSFATGSSVLLNSNGAKYKTNGQWAGATLYKSGQDTWEIYGNTAQ